MTRRRRPARPPRVRVEMRVPEPTVEEIDRLATKYQVTRTDVFLRAANLLLEVERQNAEDGEPEAEALSGIRVSRTR